MLRGLGVLYWATGIVPRETKLTVAELIAALQQMDPSLPVMLGWPGDGDVGNATSVEEVHDEQWTEGKVAFIKSA